MQTNEERALVPQCPACGAAPGMRCLNHLSSEVYRLVHAPRGKLAGLSPSEILRLDFGDDCTECGAKDSLHLVSEDHDDSCSLNPENVVPDVDVVTIGSTMHRADDLRIALSALALALTIAEQAGADAGALEPLRAIHGKLSTASQVLT